MKNLNHFFKLFYKATIFSFLITCHASCIVNSDSSRELSGGYFFRDEGEHNKDILCHLPGRPEIYAEVIGYGFDSEFIVAAQKPNYDAYKTMIGFILREDTTKYPGNTADQVIESENVADSILKNNRYYQLIFDNKINYWIITHKDKKMFGPFTIREYKARRKELNIPEKLNIVY